MEYSFKYTASFNSKVIIAFVIWERTILSTPPNSKRSLVGGICIAVRLTCSHFFVPFSCQYLCSSVPLLLSPASMSVLLQLREMFCWHAQRTSPRDPRIQRKSKMWRQRKETEYESVEERELLWTICVSSVEIHILGKVLVQQHVIIRSNLYTY